MHIHGARLFACMHGQVDSSCRSRRRYLSPICRVKCHIRSKPVNEPCGFSWLVLLSLHQTILSCSRCRIKAGWPDPLNRQDVDNKTCE
jgi:hypothetical protein